MLTNENLRDKTHIVSHLDTMWIEIALRKTEKQKQRQQEKVRVVEQCVIQKLSVYREYLVTRTIYSHIISAELHFSDTPSHDNCAFIKKT